MTVPDWQAQLVKDLAYNIGISEAQDLTPIIVDQIRPHIEAEVRERIAAEIEADDIPHGLLDRDHDDQLTALRNWHAFIARGMCTNCNATGVDYGDPCSSCAGLGTWGGTG